MNAYRRGMMAARMNTAANGSALGFLGGMIFGIVICLFVAWGLEYAEPQAYARPDGGMATVEEWEMLP